ncbi:hypothetical protein DPMN_084623 [Dreissena polymorpha]|uniref:DUF6589 domain-containing protein n=1 Tax=Dreissena polymorpha TaxID=45954 RepID=A0A9D3YE57_DREPO|nr:hypothetical protein DPMN_084623 [Dreissena polymorpha]
MVNEQFLQYFGMENVESEPTKNMPIMKKNLSDRRIQIFEMMEKFIAEFGYLKNCTDADAQENDSVFKYCSNLCHWVVLLLNFEDVVREGDLQRIVPSVMYMMQFFLSHSNTSKYFEECLDFVMKCEFLLSPLDSPCFRRRICKSARWYWQEH